MQLKESVEYLFLRRLWSNHKVSEHSTLDDRIDSMNKVVASIKNRLSGKLEEASTKEVSLFL